MNVHGNTEEFSDSFKDLFLKMANSVPSYRLSISEIKKHEWYNGPISSEDEIKFEFSLRKKALMLKLNNYGNLEKNEEVHRNSYESKMCTSDTSASSDKSDCDKNMEELLSKLKTNKFMVENGDILVDAICWFWTSNNYQFEKSTEFFRVTLKVGENGNETFIQADIWRNSKDSTRCVEFILLQNILNLKY